MDNIRKTFLTKTIPSFLSWEVDMPYIKFLFDLDTLKTFEDYLDKDDPEYSKGLNSIQYLTQIYQEAKTDKEQIYIPVHNSKRFFELLEELLQSYTLKQGHSLLYHYNFLRSIWLRMGVNDINDVEGFLERQIQFIKAEKVLPVSNTVKKYDNGDALTYYVEENEDWFETNKNIVFSIRRSSGNILKEGFTYDFPAIHFALGKVDGKATCFIYGVQTFDRLCHDNGIKNDLQPIRKSLRNKNVSADFIIALSLFLDYMYSQGVTNIEVPTLQVFNYTYHEHLSKNIYDSYSSYTESDIEEIKELMECGVFSDKVTDYLHTKKMVGRFVDKEDSISYSKSERFINLFYELMNINPNIELLSEPFGQSENMKLKLNGESNLLDNYGKEKGTVK